jgi:hypothetical protein
MRGVELNQQLTGVIIIIVILVIYSSQENKGKCCQTQISCTGENYDAYLEIHFLKSVPWIICDILVLDILKSTRKDCKLSL